MRPTHVLHILTPTITWLNFCKSAYSPEFLIHEISSPLCSKPHEHSSLNFSTSALNKLKSRTLIVHRSKNIMRKIIPLGISFTFAKNLWQYLCLPSFALPFRLTIFSRQLLNPEEFLIFFTLPTTWLEYYYFKFQVSHNLCVNKKIMIIQ